MTPSILQLNDLDLETLRHAEGWAVVAVVQYGSKACKQFLPEFEKLAEKDLVGVRSFALLQASENPSAAASCKIHAVPTTLVLWCGVEMTRYEGPYSCETLQERLTALLRKHEEEE